jgi:exodeoxyribonuclease-3
MKIASWNVNSINSRKYRVLNLLLQESIDVLLLQETKTANFPKDFFANYGYSSISLGLNQWNGVAILAKDETIKMQEADCDPAGTMPTFDGLLEPRIVGAKISSSASSTDDASFAPAQLFSCYVPNGRSFGQAHYVYKLNWMKAVDDFAKAWIGGEPGAQIMFAGDFNVIPQDTDVWDSFIVGEETLYTSAPERKAFFSLGEKLVEVTRDFLPDEHIYTFYDYRGGRFRLNEGMRLDFVFCSDLLAKRVKGVKILRDERGKLPLNVNKNVPARLYSLAKEEKPSDHVPIIVQL